MIAFTIHLRAAQVRLLVAIYQGNSSQDLLLERRLGNRFYRVVDSLIAKGLVRYVHPDSENVFYHLTEKGMKMLAMIRQECLRIVKVIKLPDRCSYRVATRSSPRPRSRVGGMRTRKTSTRGSRLAT